MAVSPGPGDDPAPYGSEVTITVSAGVPMVPVPNVVGMNEDQAKAALEAAGLKVDATRFIGNKVRQQQPSAGESVEQGTSVKILVAF
jgi:serine/threonine-protein kinase